MKRIEVKNGVISAVWRHYPLGGTPPKSRRREGTIMVYRVDRSKLDRKPRHGS